MKQLRMTERRTLKSMESTFEELLKRDGRLVYRTKGVSMQPMLRQDRDLVIIQTPASRLKKYDVALYKRRKDTVLHRVIGVKDGHYLIRGDNTYSVEDVPDGAVFGVLSGFVRDGKEYSVSDRAYQSYARIWTGIYPLRYLGFKLRRLAIRCARRLGIVPLLKRILK